MFKRLLIANRAEVAIRIQRAARELGIATTGVVSTADRDASWQREIDEVVCVGGAAPGESYLKMERILQAGVQTGCTAVHPGWGFLAENSVFAALAEQHGLSFIGPPAAVMEKLGRKLPAKRAMAAAGLACIPGSLEPLANADDAVRRAAETGYPVMIKADAGGGGRGIRLCRNEAEVREAFGQATIEAESAFGDGSLYLEKYISAGRHIEVQVLVDTFGQAVHLGERDCSIQRNHQKLIEETPSPALTPEERAELGARAAQAAASIGYVGAGTIEFLRDASGALYFMEMNARLQVEHPISEEISGIDLVRKQLEVAANCPLGRTQQDIRLEGHSIECRINAEDPARNFRPSPGRLEVFDVATEAGPGRVRVDTHLKTGDEVPPYYDSLIAKVIATAATRDEALETMLAALGKTRIEGVATTIPLHLEVLRSEAFRRGDYDTGGIPGWKPASERS